MKKLLLLTKTLLAAVLLCVGQNAWGVTGVDVWDFSNTSVWGNETSGGKSANYKELATGSEVWFAADGSSATSETSNVSFKFVANGAKFNYGGGNRLGISNTGNYDSENDINYVKVVIPDGYKVLVDMSVGTSARPMHVDLDGSVTNYTSNGVYTYTNSTGSSKTIKVYGSNGATSDYKNHHINSITLVNTATAPRYGWTANAKAMVGGVSTTIKTYTSSSDVMTTDKYTVVVDKVIKYNGAYYSLNDPAFATNMYGATFTMGTSAGSHNFNYEKIENCAFYGEAESICTAQSNGKTTENSTVLSNGGGKYVMKNGTGYVTLTFNVEKAGYYDIKLGLNNTNGSSRGFNYQVDGGTASSTIDVAANTALVREINDQYLTAGNHTLTLNLTYMLTPVFDYVLVTSDYTFTEVVGNTDKSSPSGTKSNDYKIKKGETKVFTFRNYGSGLNGESVYNSWHNWTFQVNDGVTNRISARADFYDNTKGSQTDGVWNVMSTDGGSSKTGLDWDKFKEDMSAATVVATLAYGTDGTLSFNATSTGDKNGYIYYVDHSVSDVTADELTVNLFVEYSWLGVISVDQTAVAATIGANGFTTFASPYPLDLTSATQTANGFTAYRASSVNSTTVTFKDDVNQNVQANTGVLLKGKANAVVTIPVVASGSALADNALLVNASGNTFTAAANTTYYGMNKDSDPLTFGEFDPSSVAIPANKAYLTVATGGGARAIVGVFGDITGVENVEAAPAEAKTKEGKFIENGKLVIVKNGQKFNAAGAKLY